MEMLTFYGPLIARMLLALVFLHAGIGKMTEYEGTREYMASAGMPATEFFLILATIADFGGGLSVLFGYYARLGALVLFIYTALTIAIFHRKISDQRQMIMFMKNLAIMGGLLLVMVYGAGPISLN